MPWKLTFIDTLLPKPAKNFPHYKTNGAERWITIMIHNDTCSATLGRTSPLARRMVGGTWFLSPQVAIWCTNLGSVCDRKLRSHFSIVPIFTLIKGELFFIVFLLSDTHTHAHTHTLTLTLTLSYPWQPLPPIDFLSTSVLRNRLKRE